MKNREIKFRAWDIDSSEMFYTQNQKGYCDPYFDFDKEAICLMLPTEEDFAEKRNTVIEQFTGLHDKNGVDIFEGDIVLHRDYKGYDSDKWQIIFYSGAFWIAGLPSKIRIYNVGERCGDLEIIGNIHQNPELLS